LSRVIQRCPNCGVEHDGARREECEVCGTPLRFWCRMHGREIGWLDGPDCPRCAADAVEARRPVPPPPPSTTAPRRPRPTRAPAETPPPRPAEPRPTRVPRRPPPVPVGRDPGDVLREGAEEWAPRVASGARVFFSAIFTLVRTVLAWLVIGLIGGAGYSYATGDDIIWSLSYGLAAALIVGVLIGAILAIRVLVRGATARRR